MSLAQLLLNRLRDLRDVVFGTPSSGHAPVYNAATGKFEVRAIAVGDITALATASPSGVNVVGVRDERTSNDEGYLIATDFSGRMSATFLPTIALTTTGNLASLSNVATARTNLGLGTVATLNTGTSSGNVPVLGAGGKLASSTLPALAITDTFVAASQSAMLALSTAETGDVCVRTDLSKSFILRGSNPATLADWQELLTPTDAVSSVNGQTGVVSLTGNDIATDVPWGSPITVTEAVEYLRDNKIDWSAIGTTEGTIPALGEFGLLPLSTIPSHTHAVGDLSDADYRGEGTEPLLAATTALASPLAVVWFGSGADGNLTVSSGTTNVTTSKSYANVTVSGGTLVLGVDSSIWGRKTIRVSGTLTLSGAGVIRGALHNQVGPTAGARKTTAGAGNASTSSFYTTSTHFGGPGGGAAGGGDGTNAGGSGRTDGYRLNSYFSFPGINYTNETATPAGTTGAGTNGSSPAQPYSLPSSAVTMAVFAGALGGYAGGGGACKVAGGSNYGGAGGAAGRGSCGLELYVHHLVITTGSGCVISAAGEAGSAGEAGNAVNASGDICGGGGGGGGGAGGFIVLICRKLTVNGTRRNQAWVDAGNLSAVLSVAGGAGGAGGGGREHNGTPNQARAASNGGTGSAGTNGAMYIVVTN